jgi:hypothetical protein
MTVIHLRPSDDTLPRPRYVWIAVVLEMVTALCAIPVGLALAQDPTGAGIGLPHEWIEGSAFGSYLVPGLYLLLANGLGMLVVAALTVASHPTAPWLTGILGTGLLIWIVVQVVVLPEVSPLQAAFGVFGIALMVVSVLWLRASGQLAVR